MNRLVRVRLVAGWLLVMGVVAALGVPAGAQNSPPPDTPHAGDVASASCVAPAPHGFTDVPANSYYNVAVGWLVEAGITSGTVPGKYSPNSPVTRAQMALFLWHSADSPAPAGNHGFTDIPANSYYGDAVSWLVEAGITAGTSAGKYSPNRAVTRAQMAVFLWSAAGSPAPIGTHGFSDVVASSYYETAVTWLVEQQITSGTSPGKFSPSNPVTRAQMAVFLWHSACPIPAPTPPIAAGDLHSCALKHDAGTVSCWGSNTDGQLGDGTNANRSTPTTVPGLTGVTAITAGPYYSCALKQGGTVSCWGSNSSGQLGDGSTIDRLTPTPVPGLTDVTAITAGKWHACALKQGGTVSCWGYNYYGQLGDGSNWDRLTPTPVAGLADVTAITAGYVSSCALKRNGTTACWGANEHGQLGDGTITNRLTPTTVPGLTDVTAITAGKWHACALKQGGTVSCWGYNYDGQLGDGSTTDRLTPTPVTGLTDVTAITAGYVHSCALNDDGTAACWGDNSWGELGDSTTTDRLTPTPVTGLTDVTAITAGYVHSCALNDDGTAACWGDNSWGELGDGTTTSRLSPTQVLGF